MREVWTSHGERVRKSIAVVVERNQLATNRFIGIYMYRERLVLPLLPSYRIFPRLEQNISFFPRTFTLSF
jgi:hypothetical protein